MKEKIYAALSNMNRGYAYGLLWVLLLCHFNVFALSKFLDIVNHSAAPIYIIYEGTQGNAWGPCGKNYQSYINTCAIAAYSLATLKLTDSSWYSSGQITITMTRPIGQISYDYRGGWWNNQHLDSIKKIYSIGDVTSHMQTHTYGPCTTTRYNCIIYTYP